MGYDDLNENDVEIMYNKIKLLGVDASYLLLQYALEEHEHIKIKKKRSAYYMKWPLVCHKCGGYGGKSIAATRWSPQDFDECECVNDNKCPRCGIEDAFDPDSDDMICKSCSWDFNNPDGLPSDDCLEAMAETEMLLENILDGITLKQYINHEYIE